MYRYLLHHSKAWKLWISKTQRNWSKELCKRNRNLLVQISCIGWLWGVTGITDCFSGNPRTGSQPAFTRAFISCPCFSKCLSHSHLYVPASFIGISVSFDSSMSLVWPVRGPSWGSQCSWVCSSRLHSEDKLVCLVLEWYILTTTGYQISGMFCFSELRLIFPEM